MRAGSRISARTLALIAVGFAMLAAAVILGYEGRGQTLKGDEWDYAIRLSSQPLGHALVQPPPDKYLMAIPLLLYEALFETVGIGSYVPYRAVGIALVVLCAGLFFLLARRRVGDMLATPPTVLLLFFGSASDVVATSLRIPSLIAIAAGLATLLALDRRTLRGDVAACLLLGVSLAAHPEGIAFAAAAAVLVLFRRSLERWRRSWVFAVPVAVFAAWWFWNSQSAGTQPAFDRLPHAPGFIADSFTTVTANLTGLAGVISGPAFDNALGWIAADLLIAFIALALVRRSKPIPPFFWAILVALIALLIATAVAPIEIPVPRTPATSRYLYPEAVLLLLLLVEVARVTKLPRTAAWIAVAVLIAGLAWNLADLQQNAARWRDQADVIKAQLAALDISRGEVRPSMKPFEPEVAMASGRSVRAPTEPGEGGQGWLLRASEYFRIARDFGSPAYSPEELTRASIAAQSAADAGLARALRLRLRPARGQGPPSSGPRPRVDEVFRGAARTRASCVELVPRRGDARAAISLRPPGARLRGLDSDAEVGLSRFAPIPTTTVPVSRSSNAKLELPRDGSTIPWKLWVTAAHRLEVCGLRAARGDQRRAT